MNEFRWFRDHYSENVERMFAAVGDLYAEYWDDFFHFAIFEQEGEDRAEAFRRTHQRYVAALNIQAGDSILELACGRGGFADFIAAETGAWVLGIDLSPAQLCHARRHDRPNLRFLRHDIMKVDLLGEGTFDAVAFMDADIYLPDKQEALERIGRVMRPGARLLLIAWCKQPGLSVIQEEMVLEPFMRFWGVPGIETAPTYRHHFRQAELRLIEEIDLNEQVRPNWDFGYDRAIEAVRDAPKAIAAKIPGQAAHHGRGRNPADKGAIPRRALHQGRLRRGLSGRHLFPGAAQCHHPLIWVVSLVMGL